jgi:L-fucose isomerase-like protein
MESIAAIAMARTTFDIDVARAKVDDASAALHRVGAIAQRNVAILTEHDDVSATVDALSSCNARLCIVLQATFTDSSAVIRIAETTDIPLLVWSFPEARTGRPLRLNSLCGANMAAFSLRRRGHRVSFLHADPSRCDIDDRLASAIASTLRPEASQSIPLLPEPMPVASGGQLDRRTERTVAALASARVGVIGFAPPGFEPCLVDADELRSTVGTTIESITLDTLFEHAGRHDPDADRAISHRVARDLDIPDTVRTSGLSQSLDLYAALRSVTAEHGWSAVTTRCWPECFTEHGGAACAPQAMLTADGCPAVCEADAYGAVTALMLRVVAGSDPFVADLIDADDRDDSSVFWHCGSASLHLAAPDGPRRGAVHPNRHRALIHEFALKPGRVTVARLSRASGTPCLVIGSGELLERPRPFAGTCGVMRWDPPVADVLSTIFTFGVEHHYGLVYGEHRAALVDLAAAWGLPVIRLGHDGVDEPGARSPLA